MPGEIVFDALGERWTLVLGNAAQCAVEQHFGGVGFFAVVADAMPDVDAETALAVVSAQSTGAAIPGDVAARVVAAMRGLKVSTLRELAYFGLRRHHAAIDLETVSDIIDDLGGDRFGEIIGRAIRAAQGNGGGDDAAPGKAPRRATRASRPTGTASSRSGANTASKPRPSGTRPPRRTVPPSGAG